MVRDDDLVAVSVHERLERQPVSLHPHVLQRRPPVGAFPAEFAGELVALPLEGHLDGARLFTATLEGGNPRAGGVWFDGVFDRKHAAGKQWIL